MDLDQWLTALAAEIDSGPVVLDADSIRILLDVARDAAHEVERVAAPLTTFLLGVAVGRGASLAEVAERTTALVLTSGGTEPGTAPGAG